MSTIRASTSRAFGPASAAAAHCSVTEVDEDVELRPVDLQQPLEVLHHSDRIDGRRRHQVVRGSEARGRAVVVDDAVLAQHHAVAAAADGERVPAVDVDAIQQFGDVAPLQLDLAERGDVDHAHVRAHVLRLAVRGVVGRLAGSRIRMRPLPQPGVDEARAVLDVPVVHRGVPRRFEMHAAFPPRERAERDGRVRRAKRRRADLGNRPASRLGEERSADDAARLALVRSHAERRVALQMLDRCVALARGELDVVDGDIGLQIDEALVAAVAGGHAPERVRAARRHRLQPAAPPATGATLLPRAAARPAACPSASAAARPKAPFAAPAATIGSGDDCGSSAAKASS